MANYYRITAYHPEKNISVIMDSYGMFEKLWQFSAFLVEKVSILSPLAKKITLRTEISKGKPNLCPTK